MEELIRLLNAMQKASEELLQAIRKDAKIADGMRDVWANLNSGAER